ncbi:MAG TPA: superoxide dismutase [Caulobacteraceae bacterium]|jgi:Fe-Mn family superoxide dismutase
MFDLPDLPYAYDALEPVISSRTMKFHHDKHHKTYVETLNKLLADAKSSPDSLESVIRDAKAAGETKLFNNAAQAWNHAFFWNAMTATVAKPSSDLATAIDSGFGGLAGLKSKFVEAGVGQFGSGWAWLTADKQGKLAIVPTPDAGLPSEDGGQVPILVCDVWEHAYYLDHQNDRKGFLEAWFDALPNWSFAAKQFAAAKGQGDAWRYPAPHAAEPLKRAG